MILWFMIVFSSNELFCNEKLIYIYVILSFYTSILIPKVGFFILSKAFYVSILFLRYTYFSSLFMIFQHFLIRLFFLNFSNNKLTMLLQEFLILFISILCFFNSSFRLHYSARKQFSEAKTLEIEEKKVNDFLSILVPKFVKYLMTQGIFSLSQPQIGVSVLFCDICNFDDIISSQNTDIVRILDHIYRIFDGFCLQYGVQKIEVFSYFLNKC